MSRLCVIANREPYIHVRDNGFVRVMTPASGLVTALEPIVASSGGLWIAHGSGDADRETSAGDGTLGVPPWRPAYHLKRVWLTEEEEQGYYYGFANEGLWPLCHIVHARPVFRSGDWEHYVAANLKFAEAFVEQVREESPVILAQDYHFALLPAMLRNRRPGAAISLFWHIPWSGPDVTRICPWKEHILAGMLGADLLGFQTQYHCNNFLDCVDRFLEARVDREQFSVTRRGHTCYVRAFPISIEWPPRHHVPAEQFGGARREISEELGVSPDTRLAIGVDRIDYTKGIPERLLAVETMLDRYPELVGKFIFIQIGAPSRTRIPRYRELAEHIVAEAARINGRFSHSAVPPIQLRLRHHESAEVFRFYRAADVCIVNSLHDGMNLVAKEFVGARSDGGGALVLSSFTGAARELNDAFIINPYDIDGTAEAVRAALLCPKPILEERMRRLRETVAANDIYAWGRRLMDEIGRIARAKLETRVAPTGPA